MQKLRELPRGNRAEPGYSFYNAVLRVRWAYWQLRNFRGELATWLRAADSMFTIERHGSKVVATIEAPEMQFWAIYTYAADIVQSLRSSLDYCWMGLIRAANGSEANLDKFVYPIGGTIAHLEAVFGKAPLGPFQERARMLVFERLSLMQDGKRDRNKPLSILHDLNNWQKHNALPIMFGALHIPEVVFSGGRTYQSVHRNVTVPYGESVTIEVHHPYTRFEWSKDVSQSISFDGFPSLEGMNIIDALSLLAETAKDSVGQFLEVYPEAVWFDVKRVFGPGMRGKSDTTYRFI